jgi:hypothetical protein
MIKYRINRFNIKCKKLKLILLIFLKRVSKIEKYRGINFIIDF